MICATRQNMIETIDFSITLGSTMILFNACVFMHGNDVSCAGLILRCMFECISVAFTFPDCPHTSVNMLLLVIFIQVA